MSLNVENIRKEFPILKQKVNGKPMIFLDNAATTQKSDFVLQKYLEFYKTYNANAHRGGYYLSNKATEAYENARKKIKQFINAKNDYEVIFTRGTTESINLVAGVFEHDIIHAGDEVIVTEMEHHSNYLPWKFACERKNAILKILPFDDTGRLLIENLPNLITSKTKMIAVTHISNVLGIENPIKEIIDLAHKNDVPVLVDAAQSAPHQQIDVQDLDCDFLVFSGHKMFSPNGIGVIYGKEKWLNRLSPWQSGGEMVNTVKRDLISLNALPKKFEAGTSNVAGAVALSAAIEYIENIGWESVEEYESKINSYTFQKLSEIEGIRMYSQNPSTRVFSFNIDGIHSYDIGMMLDNEGIAVRTGQLCAGLIMEHFGAKGMIRASLAFYNTFEEIDEFCDKLIKIKNIFQSVKK